MSTNTKGNTIKTLSNEKYILRVISVIIGGCWVLFIVIRNYGPTIPRLFLEYKSSLNHEITPLIKGLLIESALIRFGVGLMVKNKRLTIALFILSILLICRGFIGASL